MTESGKFLGTFRGLSFHLRVSRRRRSVGLTVTDGGELLVHAPRGVSMVAVHRVIEKNLAWIERKRAGLREAWACLEKGKAYFRGQALALELVSGGRGQIHLTDGRLRLFVDTGAPDPWPRLLAWYYRQAEVFLARSVQHFAPRLKLAPPPLEVRQWRRRWGECRADGRLRFNWRLVLLPPETLDYVVVHELAHLLVPGHPPRFWQEVGKHLPDYAERRLWLKVYGAPFLCWRFEQEENRGLPEHG